MGWFSGTFADWSPTLISLGGGGAGAAAIGSTTVRTFTRGLLLHFRKDFRSPLYTTRTDVIDSIKDKLASVKDDRHVLVLGPGGVGKTAAVGHAVRDRPGSILYEVPGGSSSADICNGVYDQVARNQMLFLSPSAKDVVRKVLIWYQRLRWVASPVRSWKGEPAVKPLVVLSCATRSADEKYSEAVQAARDLSVLGFRVILDSSDNALSDTDLASSRASKVHVSPMSAELVPAAFSDLFEKLKAVDDAEKVVLAVVGGIFATLDEINDDVTSATATIKRDKKAGLSDDAISKKAVTQVLDDFVRVNFAAAIKQVGNLCRGHKQLFDALVNAGFLLDNDLKTPASSFEAVRFQGVKYVPSNPLYAFIFKHKLYEPAKNVTTFAQVRDLALKPPAASTDPPLPEPTTAAPAATVPSMELAPAGPLLPTVRT